MSGDASVPIVFFAGVISFLSPCVLPLVPGYVSYMSGVSTGETDSERRRFRTLMMALAFVGGFTAVFVPLGAAATQLGAFLRENQQLLTRIGGVLIIGFGLVFMGVIKAPFLYREARFHPTPRAGLCGSALLGGAFAFGWTPCIGPVLGIVLTMAAGSGAQGSPAEGALLLGVYSLGLGVPFLVVAVGIERLTGALAWLRRHIRVINLAGGALLVLVGILFVTGQLFHISIWIQKAFVALNLDRLANI